MRFKGFANNQDFMVEAKQLGGYTTVFIWPNATVKDEKIHCQIFVMNAPDTPLADSEEFLERAARVALHYLEVMPTSGDRIRVYGYGATTRGYTGALQLVSEE